MAERTLEQLQAMQNRELDAVLAECLGWEMLHEPTLDEWYWKSPAGTAADFLWMYSSPNSPRSLLDGVEAEIERRYLRIQYLAALLPMLKVDSPVKSWIERWALATASARLRTIAAILTLEGSNHA